MDLVVERPLSLPWMTLQREEERCWRLVDWDCLLGRWSATRL